MPGTPFRQSNRKAADLTWADVDEIRRRYSLGETQGSLARAFKKSIVQIGRIVRGESWNSQEREAGFIDASSQPAQEPSSELTDDQIAESLRRVQELTQGELRKVTIPAESTPLLDKLKSEIKSSLNSDQSLDDLLNIPEE